ncbi:MAG: symmetrical bis(5'-nucleosyl)-tetraphosphatase [Pseudomonadota bacterium]
MATYAIGDVQGCFDELQALLAQIQFDPARDRLWFVGDLINRGPHSLETLRFVKDLGTCAITVLGNHDLHALAVAETGRPLKPQDSLTALLAAPDRDELLDWLRRQPLLHHDALLGFTLIHAGLPPQWDLAQAQACAREVEALLRGDRYHEFFPHMYGDEPAQWDDALRGWDRIRFIVNCFTRLRYCTADGHCAMLPKGAPGTQPAGLLPWFAVPQRRSREARIVFGHWSTLGLYQGHNVFALDTGCLWGGSLSALRLEDLALFQVPCSGFCTPGEPC